MIRIIRNAHLGVWLLLFALVLASPAAAQQAAPEQAPTEIVALHLNDGTIIVGEVLSEDAGKIRVRSKTLGEITIDEEDVEHRGPSEGIAAVAVHAAEAAEPPTHGAPAWTRAVTASAAWVSPPFTQGELSGGAPGLTGAALRLPGAQANVQLGFTIRHTSPDDAFSMSGGANYVDTEPLGRVSEALSVNAEYSRVMTPRTYLLSSTTFRRDKVRHIDNSFAELAGVGFKVFQHPKFRFDFVAGGAMLRENKNTQFDDTLQPQIGVSEAFLYQINPRSSLSHRVVYRVGIRESEIWNFESQTSLQAGITSRLSLIVGLTWNHDNILGQAVTPLPPNALFPGSPALSLLASQKTFRQITSGLQFSF